MAEGFIDVLLELPLEEVRGYREPNKEIMAQLRAKVEEVCEQKNAQLIPTRPPEIDVQEGKSVVDGQNYFLIASRWAVTGPVELFASHPLLGGRA